ncbi:hypothetical protein G7L40_20020 [Paenibacillus polymyxa]|uniref:Uncharacterized protein n=1 Tax=Paenibacillus polymyxa TaxID=1406 RepID=A0A378XZE0_PAEPO|nr:hypothetical protein [Paenibacillus polymyxa]MBE7896224.1 hypothetical protein [Paenibacillus polymyxa]MBG9765845.1 hypothetical protein [Paenibacillus polymyxa]MCC3256753.1 hypothetical protein [Paenibacillus polymyxa]QPK54760.1 hypothetical protein G7035_20060 [Paenibacillus polymyxa]QPK59851.1 hypothetical protein G7L40_20020 [Paenibacillus polymyxa]
MKNNKSVSFDIMVSDKVSVGDLIDVEGKKMYITKIKSVEAGTGARLLVQGLCKEDQISKMLRKYIRN